MYVFEFPCVDFGGFRVVLSNQIATGLVSEVSLFVK